MLLPLFLFLLRVCVMFSVIGALLMLLTMTGCNGCYVNIASIVFMGRNNLCGWSDSSINPYPR